MTSLPCIYFRLTKAWALLNYYSLSFDLAQTRVPHAILSVTSRRKERLPLTKGEEILNVTFNSYLQVLALGGEKQLTHRTHTLILNSHATGHAPAQRVGGQEKPTRSCCLTTASSPLTAIALTCKQT